MQIWVFAGAAAGLLAACGGPAPPQVQPDFLASCGGDQMQGMIGQPQSALGAVMLGERTRLISPGMRVTEDYAPSRLNIYLSEAGIITQIRCG